MGWSRATVRVGPAINRVKDPMTKLGRNEVVPFFSVICIGGAMPTRSPLPLGTIEGYVKIRDIQVLKHCVFFLVLWAASSVYLRGHRLQLHGSSSIAVSEVDGENP